jgi:hypothetical protein
MIAIINYESQLMVPTGPIVERDGSVSVLRQEATLRRRKMASCTANGPVPAPQPALPRTAEKHIKC